MLSLSAAKPAPICANECWLKGWLRWRNRHGQSARCAHRRSSLSGSRSRDLPFCRKRASRMTDHHMLRFLSNEKPSLALPSADAAAVGIAGPFLDTDVHGLGVQWIAVPVRKLHTRSTMRLFAPRACETAVVTGGGCQLGTDRRAPHALDRDLLGVTAREDAIALCIAPGVSLGLDRNRRKRRRRAERLWRQHGLGEVEPEELVRPVVGRRGCAARDQRGADKGRENSFQDHSGLLKHGIRNCALVRNANRPLPAINQPSR